MEQLQACPHTCQVSAHFPQQTKPLDYINTQTNFKQLLSQNVHVSTPLEPCEITTHTVSLELRGRPGGRRHKLELACS